MKIVVGSTAWNKFNPDIKVNDLDIWYTADEQEIKGNGIDAKLMPDDIMKQLLYHTRNIDGVLYANLQALYTIKLSHSIYDVKWCKTRDHLMQLQLEGDDPIYYLLTNLQDYWKITKPARHNLNFDAKASEFFEDKVERPCKHDYLHRMINRYPIYLQALEDGYEVKISERKFNHLLPNEKFQLFDEEIRVLALERFLLNGSGMHWYEAYQRALGVLVTRLTEDWQAQWIMNNLHDFVWVNGLEYIQDAIISKTYNGYIYTIVVQRDGKFFKVLSPDGIRMFPEINEVKLTEKVVTTYETL